MNKKFLIGAAVVIIAVLVVLALFQMFKTGSLLGPAPAPKRAALIMPIIPPTDLAQKGFKDKMAELGYVEGKDIVYEEVEYLPPERDKLQEAFRDAAQRNVDIIYTLTTLFTTMAYN